MTPPNNSDSRTKIRTLVEQRERLRGWIEKLDAVGSDAPDRVAQKIRSDYEERLDNVTGELGGFRGEIQGDLDSRQDEVKVIEEHRTEAADALEETRLRHLIGELDDSDWNKARPSLEREVGDADDELTRLRGEVDELSQLLTDISGADERATRKNAAPESVAPVAKGKRGKAVAEDATEAKPLPEPVDLGAMLNQEIADEGAGGDEALPWLDDLDEKMNAWEGGEAQDGSGLEFLDAVEDDAPAAPQAQEIEADDLAFLEELDRAIAGSTAAEPVAETAAAAEPAAVGEAKLICKDCGASNEAHAWYCEVCGSEL